MEAIAALSTEDCEFSGEVVNMDFQELPADKNAPRVESEPEDEEEEEEAPAKEAAKYKRVITWDVVPADTEANMDDCIAKIKSISIPGVNWTGIPSIADHVFGMKKIVITCEIVVEDDLTDTVMEAIAALSTEDCEFSGEVINMDFQEMPKAKKAAPSEVDALKAELASVKKDLAARDATIVALKAQLANAGKKGGDSKKDNKKDNKKEAKKEEAAPAAGGIPMPAGPAIDRKLAAKCEQDGKSKASELKKMSDESGNMFFAAPVDACEGSLPGLIKAMEAADKAAPALGKLFASHGVEQLAIVCRVPAALADKVNVKEWAMETLDSIGGLAASKDFYEGEGIVYFAVPASKGNFPIKMKDEATSAAFGFLRSKGLIVEEEDEGVDMAFLDDENF
jgi:translation elongation factor EF-1beta